MFGNKPNKPANHEQEVSTLKHEHALEVQQLRSSHELALKEKEFELRHFKDDELKQAREKLSAKDQEIAVLKKENEMLGRITNLNADIIDVKDLVKNLIDKLPEFKISNLTVNGGSTGTKD